MAVSLHERKRALFDSVYDVVRERPLVSAANS